MPSDRTLVVERFRDELGDWRVCVLTPFGGRVHAPWALAIGAAIRERLGVDLYAIWTDDGMALRLPEGLEETSLEELLFPDAERVEDLVVRELGGSALFASHFRENAARALLLPRRRGDARTPLWQMRQRASDLMAVASRYGSFPILLETYRECLQDVFNLPALQDVLRGIQQRHIRVTSVETSAASPFARSLLFDYIAEFMYEGDAPLAERRAQALTLDRERLRELLGQEELRELLDPSAVTNLELELQSLGERRVRTRDQLHDLLRRVGDLSAVEVAARSSSRLALSIGSRRWQPSGAQSKSASPARTAGSPSRTLLATATHSAYSRRAACRTSSWLQASMRWMRCCCAGRVPMPHSPRVIPPRAGGCPRRWCTTRLRRLEGGRQRPGRRIPTRRCRTRMVRRGRVALSAAALSSAAYAAKSSQCQAWRSPASCPPGTVSVARRARSTD